MFVSVKERARQIASGQFTAPTTSAPVASLIDPAPEPRPATVATPKKTDAREAPAKAVTSPSKTRLSKVAPPKESISKFAPPNATPPPATVSKTAPLKPTSPPKASTPKKPSSKSKVTKESSPKPSSPTIGSSKTVSTGKAPSQAKASLTPQVASPTKPTPSRIASTPSKSRRSKSPPKRVDSPIEDNDDPLSSLKSTCLKQVSGVTGLGGRRLAIVLKQRSSGEWYAALKDMGSDKYLKMWMNRDRTFATKEEALEAYLVFVTKKRNEVRWFPLSPRASSPKGKGK